MIEQLLRNLGWHEKDIIVYMATIKYGPQAASVIANKCNLNRSTVYAVLIKLVKLGVINQSVKGNIRYFSVDNINDLIRHIDLERLKYKEMEEDLKKAKKEIMLFKNPNYAHPRVTFYEGIEGAKKCYMEIAQKASHIDSYILVADNYLGEMQSFWETYNNLRVMNSISTRVIVSDSIKKLDIINRIDDEYCQYRLVDSNLIPSTFTEINIYGNYFQYLSHGEVVFCAIIEDKNLADTQRVIFDICWRMGIKIK